MCIIAPCPHGTTPRTIYYIFLRKTRQQYADFYPRCNESIGEVQYSLTISKSYQHDKGHEMNDAIPQEHVEICIPTPHFVQKLSDVQM